jgi:hypothetical protein
MLGAVIFTGCSNDRQSVDIGDSLRKTAPEEKKSQNSYPSTTAEPGVTIDKEQQEETSNTTIDEPLAMSKEITPFQEVFFQVGDEPGVNLDKDKACMDLDLPAGGTKMLAKGVMKLLKIPFDVKSPVTVSIKLVGLCQVGQTVPISLHNQDNSFSQASVVQPDMREANIYANTALTPGQYSLDITAPGSVDDFYFKTIIFHVNDSQAVVIRDYQYAP